MVVPAWRPVAVLSARSSSTGAHREGTGLPLWSLCVCAHVDENPKAPASSPASSSVSISQSCSGVAIEDSVRSHHTSAERRMPNQPGAVESELAIEALKKLARR